MNRIWFLAVAAMLLIANQGYSQSTTLQVSVLSPTPPILPSSTITLQALTSDNVFPDTGHQTTSDLSRNGFDISWDITSIGLGDIALQVLQPMSTTVDTGPLSPGTYHVTVNWTNQATSLSGAPTAGTGSLSFTVVPEPSTVMLAVAELISFPPVIRRRVR